MPQESTYYPFFHDIVGGVNQMLELCSPLTGLTLESGPREPGRQVLHYSRMTVSFLQQRESGGRLHGGKKSTA